VRQLTNAAGGVTDSYEYDAFGNALQTSGSTPNNYLYRGEQYDPDLGLYYLRARYYNPTTGRFMSRDPYDGNQADPRSLHKYLYAGGDPVNFVDPLGRELFGYAIQANKALATVGAVNAFSCIAGIGLTAVSSEFSLLTGVGIGSSTWGCITSVLYPTEGTFALGLKTGIDLGFCAFSVGQAIYDINQYEHHGGKRTDAIVDGFGAAIGCAATMIGLIME
jgi:RHS repeat-associated protein